jgi:hypothetical protein
MEIAEGASPRPCRAPRSLFGEVKYEVGLQFGGHHFLGGSAILTHKPMSVSHHGFSFLFLRLCCVQPVYIEARHDR